MNFAEKTFKLEKLIDVKSGIEEFIKLKIDEKSKLLYSKEYSVDKDKDIDDTIATLDEQLVEVKLAIQIANTNEKHEDGNTNNYYIYLLSSLNRRLAMLRDLEKRGETHLFLFSKETTKGPNAAHNKKIRERLTTKKEIEKRMKELANEVVKIETSISEIKPKLTEFNERVETKVKVFEGLEKFF